MTVNDIFRAYLVTILTTLNQNYYIKNLEYCKNLQFVVFLKKVWHFYCYLPTVIVMMSDSFALNGNIGSKKKLPFHIHMYLYCLTLFFFQDLGWLSSTRFNYKPGYKSYDLLKIQVLSLVENLFQCKCCNFNQ